MKNRKGGKRERERERERERKNKNLGENCDCITCYPIHYIFLDYTIPMMDLNPIDTEFPCNDLMLTNSVITNF